jgi:hypothetical protein
MGQYGEFLFSKSGYSSLAWISNNSIGKKSQFNRFYLNNLSSSMNIMHINKKFKI